MFYELKFRDIIITSKVYLNNIKVNKSGNKILL
jgi:hypothetical protein